jgi:hypothetical protein
MATLSEHHKTLTNGVGKCSVPMWSGGCPAGFCDEPAYGEQVPPEPWQRGLPRAYAPGLACPGHGGPQPKCPKGCAGIDLGDGNGSGCGCPGGKLANGQLQPPGFACDCPNHPANPTQEGDDR